MKKKFHFSIWVARDSNPELVGWSRFFSLLQLQEKTPPQTVLAFFIAHDFPYVYIQNLNFEF